MAEVTELMPKPLKAASRRLRRGEPAPTEPRRVRPGKPKAARPTILEFLAEFGDTFDGESWDRWRVVLSAIYGLPLDEAGVRFFREVTGRSAYDPPAGGWREVVMRQTGEERCHPTRIGGDCLGCMYCTQSHPLR